MSIQGQLYQSYDNFADGQLYASVGSVGSVAQNQASQFVQSFGSYGGYGSQMASSGQKKAAQPAPVRGSGIGMRVELNDQRELFVSKVNPGGSAERDGTIKVHDILLAVNGERVEGYKLSQLRPLIVGKKGTYVSLGLKRYNGPDINDYTEYNVELVRGDPIFFLEAENAKGKMKLQAMKTQLVEVDVELDGLRSVLQQAEGRAKYEDKEVQAMQERYSSIQEAIERCNEQIKVEKRMKEELKAKVPPTMDPEKQRVRELHEKLTRLEGQLSEVMVNLEEEHKQSLQMNEKTTQERLLEEMVRGKMREHEGFTSKLEDETRVGDASFEAGRQQHTDAIADLEARLAEARRRKGLQVVQASSVPFEEERASADLKTAEDERRRAEAQLIQIRQELTDEDAASKQLQSEYDMLQDKKRMLDAMALNWEQSQAEQRRRAEAQQLELKRQLDQRGEDALAERAQQEQSLEQLRHELTKARMRKDELEMQLRSAASAEDAAEREKAMEVAGLQPRLMAQQEDIRQTRAMVEARQEELEGVKREVEQHLLDERTILDTADRVSRDTDSVAAGAEAVNVELERLRAEGRQREEELAELRLAEERAGRELRDAVEGERRRVAGLEEERRRRDEESKRCYESLLKLADTNRHLAERAEQFAELHRRNIQHVAALAQVQEGLRSRLQQVGSVSGDMLFAASSHATARIQHSLQQLDALRLDYRAKQSNLDAPRPVHDAPLLPAASLHTQQLLSRPLASRPVDSAAAPPSTGSYTDQLLRSAPPPSTIAVPADTHMPAEASRQPSSMAPSTVQTAPAHSQPQVSAPMADRAPSSIGTSVSQSLTGDGSGRHQPDADGVIRLKVAVQDYIPLDKSAEPLRQLSPESRQPTLEQRIEEMTDELTPRFPDAVFHPLEPGDKPPTMASLM